MTNWRTYTIQSTDKSSSSFVKFTLDGYVNFSDESKDYIYCEKRSPFSDWEVGYRVDIDLDRTKYRGYITDIDSTTIVRLSHTSASMVRNNNMLNSMRRRVEEVGDMTLDYQTEQGVKPDGTYYETQRWQYGRK